jgi:anti-anti-sigma factor
MNITEEELAGGVTRVMLEGRLDIEGARALDAKMATLAAGRNFVIIDLERVSFIASMGLRSLVMPARTIKGSGGKIVLLKPNEMVEKVLKTSGIDTVIPIHKDLQSALAALQ